MAAAPLEPAIAAFLARQRVGHLATADAAGQPHVIPVCYALVGRAVYSVLDLKPKQRAALVVDVYAEDWSRLGYVLLRGTARLVESGPEHADALVALRERYPQYR